MSSVDTHATKGTMSPAEYMASKRAGNLKWALGVVVVTLLIATWAMLG